MQGINDDETLKQSLSINSNSSAELCRICYLSDKNEELIHPCKCSGTMGLIHKTCLEKWLSSSNTNECEICHYKFTVKRKTRPFYQWFMRPVSNRDNKNLLGDLICFFVLTPLAVVSAWLCIVGALRYKQWENKWEAIGLVILTCFLMFIYLTWCIISLRYHVKVFKEWQSQNNIVSLNMLNNNNYKSPNIRFMNSDLTPTIFKPNNKKLNNQFTTIHLDGDASKSSLNTLLMHENQLEQTDELLNSTRISNDSTLPFANII